MGRLRVPPTGSGGPGCRSTRVRQTPPRHHVSHKGGQILAVDRNRLRLRRVRRAARRGTGSLEKEVSLRDVPRDRDVVGGPRAHEVGPQGVVRFASLGRRRSLGDRPFRRLSPGIVSTTRISLLTAPDAVAQAWTRATVDAPDVRTNPRVSATPSSTKTADGLSIGPATSSHPSGHPSCALADPEMQGDVSRMSVPPARKLPPTGALRSRRRARPAPR